MQQITRQVFTTNRAMEFFTEKELSMQIGSQKDFWAIQLLKELVDNSLDACESVGTPPVVKVAIGNDWFSVQDNGPGLPKHIIEKSLDYNIRVSSNNYIISPTRGQLGNALKCLWAAPFVKTGKSLVEVHCRGQRHTITVSLDMLRQEPKIEFQTTESDLNLGTLVKVWWSDDDFPACLEKPASDQIFTNAQNLIYGYKLFNPHAEFWFKSRREEESRLICKVPVLQDWQKWTPNQPTSPWWYTPQQFQDLVTTHLKHEIDEGKSITVREFVSQFAGLSGTAKQKRVLEATGLSGKHLSSLLHNDQLATDVVTKLQRAMCEESAPIIPQRLGVLGEGHLKMMAEVVGVDLYTFRYKQVRGKSLSRPFVVEAWFGVCDSPILQAYGLNFSPVFSTPIPQLPQILEYCMVESEDPVLLGLHVTCPYFNFIERGKGRLNATKEMLAAIDKAIAEITKPFRNQKRHIARGARLSATDAKRAAMAGKLSLAKAADMVMEQAYLHASDQGRLPANARQIMYAARPLVLELTGGKCWKSSQYFTQGLLPDFINNHPDLTADWDVVYDARGKLIEPHTQNRVDLGTVAVRNYTANWSGREAMENHSLAVNWRVSTRGPRGRYKFALFLEKEGFSELLQHAQIAEIYDLAIFSTKGMSVTAARSLVEQLSTLGVTILVLHDFDKAGFSIVHTLRTDTRRYQFTAKPKVIDLGLRLSDVDEMSLGSEYVKYSGKADPRENLQESGATQQECNFLVRGRGDRSHDEDDEEGEGSWYGERVELNAMTSRQFLEFLERKLSQVGVTKVIPQNDELKVAYLRAQKLAYIQQAIDKAEAELECLQFNIPSGLAEALAQRIEGTPQSWDEALWMIVNEEAEKRTAEN